MQSELPNDTIRELGPLLSLGANRFFTLNDQDGAWYIARGSVDVFTVLYENGVPLGARSFFFEMGEGGLLFGIDKSVENSSRGLLAVPTSGAELIRLDENALRSMAEDDALKHLLIQATEHWLALLSHAISKDINPRTDQLIEPGHSVILDPNRKIRSKKGIVWAEVISGNALFLDMKEIAEPGRRSVFPVSQDSWILTMEKSEIKTCQTGELFHENELRDWLNYFYETIFYCDYFNTRLLAVDEFNRLNDKGLHQESVLHEALFKISSVVNARVHKNLILPGSDPLLMAASLVAEAAGIQIRAPEHKKNESNQKLQLNDILRASRVRARKVRCAGEWWKNGHGPLLAFTADGGHPVAIVPGKNGRFNYISPTQNARIPLSEKTARMLQPEAWQFYRPFPEKPITGINLIQFGMKSCTGDLVAILVAGIAGGLLTLPVPFFTGLIFDQVIPYTAYRDLYVYLLIILSGTFSITLLQLIRSFSMVRIETKLDFSLQSALWDRLLNLPVSFFKKYQAGELASSANSILVLRNMLTNTVIYSMLGSVFMFLNFAVLIYYDWKLSIVILLILTLAILLMLAIGRKIRKQQELILSLQNKIFGKLIQFLSSISKIRIAGTQVHAFALWAHQFSEVKVRDIKVRTLFMKTMLMSGLIPVISLLVVFAALSYQSPGSMSTGGFMAIYAALMVIVASFLQMGQAGISFFMSLPYLGNLKPILETLPENTVIKPDIQNLTGEIEVSNVNFRYQENAPLVLKNVSMHILPGEFVAIAGASGSGKSTLLRLLLGFENPESGGVYYDRQDISSFDPASLRRQAGTVLQNSQLAAGTILSNIAGVTEATFEDAWEAARNVGLDEDIRQMPMGMYTMVTGGLSTLSGGQRQRIMIARAIVSKPRIIFFDEATSALDNRTQQIVTESLEKLQATRIVIAHRVSTILHADRIYVMDQGTIAEAGTYEELMAKNGIFTELVKRQV